MGLYVIGSLIEWQNGKEKTVGYKILSSKTGKYQLLSEKTISSQNLSIENAELNKLGADQIKFSCGNLLEDNYIGKGTTFELDKNVIKGMQHMTADMQYDIVVANILADVIIPLSGVVRPFMKENGLFITSGIIADKEADVVAAMKENGFDIVDVVTINLVKFCNV